MADYDIIKANGQTIKLTDGQVFENKIIDLTTGESFQINARNRTGWTIRNIGFKGYYEGAGKVMSISDDSDGTSLVENVYMGDGASKSGSSFIHGPGAIHLGVEHTGHITFRNCNVQGWPDNGFNCSSGTGTVRFEDCYAANNGIANYRTGVGGDEIVGCVGYNDTTDYGWYHRQNDYVEENGRNVWAWTGTVDITDSHFESGPYPNTFVTHDGGSINFNSGSWDGGPTDATRGGSITIDESVTTPASLTMPEGVPTRAQEAVPGEWGGVEYETYDVATEGNITLSDGENLENVLIDMGDQEPFQITAMSGSHTIRNVGTIGTYEQEDQLIAIEAPDPDDTIVIEDCYFGEGDPNASASERGREMWVSPDHAGSLEVRRCNFNLEHNMAIYGSAPNRNSGGAGGSVLLEDCYAIDPHHSGWRVCGDDDVIRNCVVEVTEDAYTNRGIYIETPSGNPGSVVTIEDSHVVMNNNGQTLRLHSGASVDVTGGLDLTGGTSNAGIDGNVIGSIGDDPQLYVPDGVPTDAEEAASGAIDPDRPDPIDPTTPPGEDHSYETIVANDQTIYIDDHEVYQNKLFDCTNGKTVRLHAVGVEDWQINNVGWMGQSEDVGEYQNIRVAVPEGGTGHIENVYMPGVEGNDSIYSGITVAPEHAGTLTARRFYAEQFTNFGLNAARHGRPGAGNGTVNLDRSHIKDVSGAGVSLSSAGDVVSNTTVHLTTAGAPKSGPGIYADATGPVYVDNCTLSMNGLNYAFSSGAFGRMSEMIVTNTAYDNTFFGGVLERYGSTVTFGSGNTTNPPSSPSPHMLVPTSAEAAAGGDPVTPSDPPFTPPTPAGRLEYPGAIAVIHAEFPGGVVPIPLYDPDDVEWAAMKVQLSNPEDDPDDIGAFAITPRADAAFPGISVETAGGIFSPTHLGEPRRVPIPPGEDGGGGGEVPDPGSDPNSVLIDDFDAGISSSWSNSSDWESSGVEAFRGGRSARRLESGLALQGGPGQFGEWMRKGGPFIRFATRANTSAENTKTSFEFARSEIPHESSKWGMQIDWDTNTLDINAIDAAGNDTAAASDTVDTPGLERKEWYDCVGHWASDDTIRFWLYASDGTELAYAEADGDGRDGNYFAINTTRPTNIYVDEVSFYEAHPHTGEDSTATIGGGEYTEPQARVVDTFEYDDAEAFADNYAGNIPKFEVAPTPGLTDGTSIRLRTERYAGGEFYSMPGDGLPFYPEEGDTITWRFRANRSSETASGVIRHRLRFGLTESGEYFDATLNIPNRRYFLAEKTEDIDRTAFSESAPSAHIPENRWIRGELEWRTNRIRLRYVDDISNEVLAPWIEGTPNHHNATDGGIAVVHYAVDATDEVYTDSISLSPEDEP